MGPIGSPETSVLNNLTTRNNPEDGRIQKSLDLFKKKLDVFVTVTPEVCVSLFIVPGWHNCCARNEL
jgi:hypothetical protein